MEQPKPYDPSKEEIKKAEKMMTEEQKTRSNEREETINAAGGKLEDVPLKTKIKQLEKVTIDQERELYGKEAYEIGVVSEDGIRVGLSLGVDKENCLRLENPRTHETHSIPVKSIKRIEKAGWQHQADAGRVLYEDSKD